MGAVAARVFDSAQADPLTFEMRLSQDSCDGKITSPCTGPRPQRPVGRAAGVVASLADRRACLSRQAALDSARRLRGHGKVVRTGGEILNNVKSQPRIGEGDGRGVVLRGGTVIDDVAAQIYKGGTVGVLGWGRPRDAGIAAAASGNEGSGRDTRRSRTGGLQR